MSTFKKSLFQLHLFVFLAGLTGPLGNLIQLSGLYLVFYRMAITSLVLFIIYLFSKNKKTIPTSDKLNLIGVGIIIAIHWVLFYTSIKLSNVSIGLVCLSSVGVFTVLLDPFFTRRSLQWKELFISLISLLGILCIFQFDTKYRIGISVGLVSSLMVALFTQLNKKLTVNIAPQTMQTFQMFGGVSFLTIIVLLISFLSHTTIPVPTHSDWGWLLILAIACTVWSNFLMLSSLKFVSPFTMNVTLNLEPVYGILISFVVFKEHKQLGFSFYIGFLLIAISVLIQMFRVIKTPR